MKLALKTKVACLLNNTMISSTVRCHWVQMTTVSFSGSTVGLLWWLSYSKQYRPLTHSLADLFILCVYMCVCVVHAPQSGMKVRGQHAGFSPSTMFVPETEFTRGHKSDSQHPHSSICNSRSRGSSTFCPPKAQGTLTKHRHTSEQNTQDTSSLKINFND